VFLDARDKYRNGMNIYIFFLVGTETETILESVFSKQGIQSFQHSNQTIT
jgi:hypothetical protein